MSGARERSEASGRERGLAVRTGATSAAKVIVVGPGEAGKSTLIQRLVAGAVNLATNGRTVAMDHGTMRRGSARLSLVGVPGQPRFTAVREALAVGAAGAVWVHPEGEEVDPDTVGLLGSVAGPLPYLVYVNRRAGQPGRGVFRAAQSLPPPIAILGGDLVTGDLGDLTEAVWALSGLTHVDGQKERET